MSVAKSGSGRRQLRPHQPRHPPPGDLPPGRGRHHGGRGGRQRHVIGLERVPAAYNEVITVSALADTDGKPGGLGGSRCYSWGGYDKDDTFADFSNYGSDVDLIAPGKCIWSTRPGNTYAYLSGTSMAAPAVTGAAALYKSSRPNATPAEVREGLQYLGTLDWKTSTDPDPYHEKLLDVSRLGPLGTFDLDTSANGYTNAHGGTSLIPVSISRSSTFFERVRFSVTSLPSGWSASLGTSSVLGWTANKTTIAVVAPDPVPAGTYRVGIAATNQGRTETGTVTVVVDNDKPTVGAPYANLRPGTLGTSTVPVTLAWPFGSDPTSWVASYEAETSLAGGSWTGHTSVGATTRTLLRTAALGRSTKVRVRARDGAGNIGNYVEFDGARPPRRRRRAQLGRQVPRHVEGHHEQLGIRPDAARRLDQGRHGDLHLHRACCRRGLPDGVEPRQRGDLGRRPPDQPRLPAHLRKQESPDQGDALADIWSAHGRGEDEGLDAGPARRLRRPEVAGAGRRHASVTFTALP